MVMAAISVFGLDAYEVLGSGPCKAQAVVHNNETYIAVLNFLGLPTLEQMSKASANIIVKQVYSIKPEFFCRRSRGGVDKEGYPCVISEDLKNTIMGELWERGRVVPTVADGTKFKEILEKVLASYENTTLRKDPMKFWRVFSDVFRSRFGCFEINDRRLGFRTPTNPLVIDKLCKVMPPSWCQSSGSTVDICLICGNALLSSAIRCLVCSSHPHGVHEKCLQFCTGEFRKLDAKTAGEFVCSDVEFQFKPSEITELLREKRAHAKKKDRSSFVLELDRFGRKVFVGRYKRAHKRFLNPFHRCSYCKEEIHVRVKNHYLGCSALGTPITKEDMRNASQNAIKKLRMMADSHDWSP